MSEPSISRTGHDPRGCFNCGSQSVGRFCARCGQDAGPTPGSLDVMGLDFLAGALNKESKLRRTLVLMLIRPGELTNEYIAGRRMRYFHPRKMYFFFSIVFFLLYALLHDSSHVFDLRGSKDLRSMGHAEIVKTAVDMAATAKSVGGEIDWVWRVAEPKVVGWLKTYFDVSDLGSGPTLRARISRRLHHLREMDPELLRERFSRSVASNTPRMFFLLLPVFALVVMLFHWRQQRAYVDHLVFAFHVHIYVFAFATIALIYESFTHDTTSARYILLLALPYLFWTQHRAYREAWTLTSAKLLGISGVYGAILAISITTLVALTFWTI